MVDFGPDKGRSDFTTADAVIHALDVIEVCKERKRWACRNMPFLDGQFNKNDKGGPTNAPFEIRNRNKRHRVVAYYCHVKPGSRCWGRVKQDLSHR
jgi:hypothetical protein